MDFSGMSYERIKGLHLHNIGNLKDRIVEIETKLAVVDSESEKNSLNVVGVKLKEELNTAIDNLNNLDPNSFK